MIKTEVLIVGAGSSGLFLANVLTDLGVKVHIIEKNVLPQKHSKAIGIHPPGLQLLNKINVLQEFEQSGVKITQAKAFVNKKESGSLNFGSEIASECILSIPQHLTESILKDNLPESMISWGYEVTEITQHKHGVVETTAKNNYKQITIESSFVIGCDGKNSKIRSLIQAKWIGNSYDIHYTMADFPDRTHFKNTAVIYLSREGLTESFPLPDNNRRWVVNHLNGEITISNLIKKIESRTGFQLKESDCLMQSNFRIHEYQSSRLHHGNVLLLGDAAHVMSPIGGQAMSLHWLHAYKLGIILRKILFDPIDSNTTHKIFDTFSAEVLSNARKYRNRASFNTKMGLPGKNEFLLKFLVLMLTKTPLKKSLIKRFTMRDQKIVDFYASVN